MGWRVVLLDGLGVSRRTSGERCPNTACDLLETLVTNKPSYYCALGIAPAPREHERDEQSGELVFHCLPKVEDGRVKQLVAWVAGWG
ncbi:MAG: hypothetical protein HN348_18220 [Proteobacteria bacterium]|nr:hypothetical protein [Pseudomonadota bacterium]